MVNRIFSVCAPPPRLVGAYYLHPQDARAIFLRNELLSKGTAAVTGGGTNGKDPVIKSYPGLAFDCWT